MSKSFRVGLRDAVAALALTCVAACGGDKAKVEAVAVPQPTAGVTLRYEVAGDAEQAARVLRKRMDVLRANGEEVTSAKVTVVSPTELRVEVGLAVGATCDDRQMKSWGDRLDGIATRSGRLGFHIAQPVGPEIVARLGKHLARAAKLAQRGRAVDLEGIAAAEAREALADLAPPEGMGFFVEETPWIDTAPGEERPKLARVWLLKTRPDVDGREIVKASVIFTEHDGMPAVIVGFTEAGAARVAETTAHNVDEFMAIVLEGVPQSVPVIREEIAGGEAQIMLGGTQNPRDALDEARDLAVVLEAGPLDATLTARQVTPQCLDKAAGN